MDDKFKEFWMKKDKEEIINAYSECVGDCESLYNRIQDARDYVERKNTFNGFKDYVYTLNIIKYILDGDFDE